MTLSEAKIHLLRRAKLEMSPYLHGLIRNGQYKFVIDGSYLRLEV